MIVLYVYVIAFDINVIYVYDVNAHRYCKCEYSNMYISYNVMIIDAFALSNLNPTET